EALRPEGQPRDAGGDESRDLAAFVGAGIRLQRDLRIASEPEKITDQVDQSGSGASRQEAGCSPAEIQGRERRARPGRTEPLVERVGAEAELHLEGLDEGADHVARS